MEHKITLSLDEFEVSDFTLVGVNTVLENYKLAYLLNKQLCVNFIKSKQIIDFLHKKDDLKFSYFEFYDQQLMIDWFLVENKFKIQSNLKKTLGLFQTDDTLISSYVYLLPEVRNADYLLKIDRTFDDLEIKSLIKKINNIKGITSAFQVDTHKLENKQHLIF